MSAIGILQPNGKVEAGYDGEMLANSRYETYCRARAAGYSQTESAKRAGYPSASSANVGCRLEKRPDIIQRIRELSVTIQPNLLLSKQWVLCEVAENHRLARKRGELAVSKQCLELIAKLQGYLIERSERYSEQHRVFSASPDVTAVLADHIQQLPAADRAEILQSAPEVIEIVPEVECVNPDTEPESSASE